MAISISSLRQNIYKLFDQVLQTGTPLEVERHGKTLVIASVPEPDRLKNLRKRNVMKCEPEELVHLDWSGEWRP